MKKKIIDYLVACGARRWTKDGKDRLYIADAMDKFCHAIGEVYGRTSFTRSMEEKWARYNWSDFYVDLVNKKFVRSWQSNDAMKGPDRDITELAVDALSDMNHDIWSQLIEDESEDEVIIEEVEEPVVEEKAVEEDNVKIKISGDYVNVFYKKDNRFISRMRYYWFTWDYDNKCWYKKVYVKGHTVQDLAAEIYYDLSECNGFEVVCEDEVVVEKATSRTYRTENEAKEELKIEKEKEEKERIVEIKYSDFKNDVWSEKIEKQVYNSYDSNKKTIKIVAKTIKDRKEIEDFYKEKKSKIPQEIRDFKDGLTDHFEIVPETINAEELEIDVPWELRNNK